MIGTDIAKRIVSKPKAEKKNLAFPGPPLKTSAHITGADNAKRIVSKPIISLLFKCCMSLGVCATCLKGCACAADPSPFKENGQWHEYRSECLHDRVQGVCPVVASCDVGETALTNIWR